MATLQHLHIYPVKSCAAITLESSEVLPEGLAFDRRWMIVDADGHFVTQRKFPQLARVCVAIVGDMLQMSYPGEATLEIPIKPQISTHCEVEVWGDRLQAADLKALSKGWLSKILGSPAHLVFMNDTKARPVKAKFGKAGDHVSFADGAPVLITTQASLQQLSEWVGSPVDMTRFRPNLVVPGDQPFEEDQWQSVQVGEVVFEVTHACARCVMTQVDQAEGKLDSHKQPLKALNQYRKRDGQVFFGMNLIPRSGGTVRVGDAFKVLARHSQD